MQLKIHFGLPSVAQIAFAYATLFNEILRCLLFSVA